MSHLDNCIICPKCQTKTMRKSVSKAGPEYFDDRCHNYFTVCELVHCWNYDLGDFGDIYPISVHGEIQVRDGGRHAWERMPLLSNTTLEKIGSSLEFPDTVSPTFEPEWKSPKERNSDYEEVTLMQLGIPVYALEDNSVDTGALHA